MTLKSPAETGVHQSKWRMMTPNGVYFGGMLQNLVFLHMTKSMIEKGSANLRACNIKRKKVNLYKCKKKSSRGLGGTVHFIES